jgi:hypothetical protein
LQNKTMTEYTPELTAQSEEPLALEPIAVVPSEQLDESTGRIAKYWHAAKRSGQWALVMTELLPSNEIIRGGLFAAGEIITRNPAMGAATIGLSTFLVEAAGGWAAADLLNTDRGKELSEKINEKSQKLHVPLVGRDLNIPLKLSQTSKIGWTFMGGTVVGMGLEQREDPSRSVEQNRKYSLLTSAWLAGVVAVGGALASEGINIGLNDPKKGGIMALGLIGTAAAGRWVKRKLVRNKDRNKI